MPEQDLMETYLEADNGDRAIWQVNRGLLSPLYLPEPEKLLTLPPGDRIWRVFNLDLGPQETQNLTVTFGTQAWILAMIGSFNNEAGFKATLHDAKRKVSYQSTREIFNNLVGTAQNPSWFPIPLRLDANSPVFLRVTNLATAEATGQLVLYSHLGAEAVSHGR